MFARAAGVYNAKNRRRNAGRANDRQHRVHKSAYARTLGFVICCVIPRKCTFLEFESMFV